MNMCSREEHVFVAVSMIEMTDTPQRDAETVAMVKGGHRRRWLMRALSFLQMHVMQQCQIARVGP